MIKIITITLFINIKMQSDSINDNEAIWDSIAKSFDNTRKKPWKQCIDFIEKRSKDELLIDIGCGNGRHLIPSAYRYKKVIGIDISKKLLDIVKDKIQNEKITNTFLIHSDATNLPIKSNSIDSVLYIAALHNIKNNEKRIQSLKEIKRILKSDGKALVSVWSRWQDKYRRQFFKKWFTQFGKNEFGNINIYWRQHGLNIPRFYHLYSKREFEKDINKANLSILDLRGVKLHSKKYPDNFFALLEKN
jgi:ubiquinone/menaquinone biosynthesis C-methylase UbiE